MIKLEMDKGLLPSHCLNADRSVAILGIWAF